MARRRIAILAVALIAGLALAVSSAAQQPAPQEPAAQPSAIPAGQGELNFTNLMAALGNLNFSLVLLVTLIAGAIGVAVYELLILQGNIERPHKPTTEEGEDKFPYAVVKYMYDLGIWARVIIGASAAVVGLWVFTPETTFSWGAIALVAGSAGTSVFRSMQDRLLAAMAQKDVSDLRQTLKEQGKILNDLKVNLETQPQLPKETFELLGRAKGLSDPWA